MSATEKNEKEKQGEAKIVEEKPSDEKAEDAILPDPATNAAEKKSDEQKS